MDTTCIICNAPCQARQEPDDSELCDACAFESGATFPVTNMGLPAVPYGRHDFDLDEDYDDTES